jgi:hypothetical protein
MKEELVFGLILSVLFQVRQFRQVRQVRQTCKYDEKLWSRLLCHF